MENNTRGKETKLIQLTEKDGVYYLGDQPMEWIKWPFELNTGRMRAWAFYKKGELRGVYCSIGQCCTGLLIHFHSKTDVSIIQLPIGVVELDLEVTSFEGDGYGYLIATGEACNGKGVLKVMENFAYGKWEWKNKIR